MKALNKFLSLILSCAMVMSLCIPAFASERMSSEELDTPFIMDIDSHEQNAGNAVIATVSGHG